MKRFAAILAVCMIGSAGAATASAAATEGTSIDFALTGIDGARGVGGASLSGFVAER